MALGFKRKCRGAAGMPYSRIPIRPTAVKVGTKYQLSDGTQFGTCQEYKHVLGGSAPNGFYH